MLSCIFSGLFVAPTLQNVLNNNAKSAADMPSSLFDNAVGREQQKHNELLNRTSGTENPYLIHQELGDVMTRAATVVRRNEQLEEAYEKVNELSDRADKCALSDTGNWSNQNVVFTKSLVDMFPIAKCIIKGALQRDECRGAHYKPAFARKGIESDDPAEQRRQAEAWCDKFQENNDKWLKSTVATWSTDSNQPDLNYEEVDTSIIPPRPRLYGLVGGEMIEKVWKERSEKTKAADAT